MGSITVRPVVDGYKDIGVAYEIAFKGLPAQKASIEWILEELEQKGRSKIVDIGCGTGRPVCEAFANAGHDVLGIDISEAMLEPARKNVPNATFGLLDRKDFLETTASNSYDVITSYFSFVSCITQDGIRSLLKQVARVLKPGGIFVYSTEPVNGNNVSSMWMGRPFTISGLSTEATLATLQRFGFEILHHEVSNFKPKGGEAGICREEDVKEETHLFVHAKKL
ncbi:hypothetical protein H2198_005585 [Neophaeococcomyces mojaviensis]|uniref:Uncharacterized protein n=1 Tax=Neophaeococcomyces mojaviensis TaxID=3383035 RepID=A0ACC3A5A1_9EURO|nr:hypothetical protein H2198_005585 [Knufia sp. JES_112]